LPSTPTNTAAPVAVDPECVLPGAVADHDVARGVLAPDAERRGRALERQHVAQRAIDVMADRQVAFAAVENHGIVALAVPECQAPARALASERERCLRGEEPEDFEVVGAQHPPDVDLTVPGQRHDRRGGGIAGGDVAFGIEEDAPDPGCVIDVDLAVLPAAAQVERAARTIHEHCRIAAAVLNLDRAVEDLAHRRLPQVICRVRAPRRPCPCAPMRLPRSASRSSPTDSDQRPCNRRGRPVKRDARNRTIGGHRS
jgi:hypothetical protein